MLDPGVKHTKGEHIFHWNVNLPEKGFYIVSLSSENESVSEKLIVK